MDIGLDLEPTPEAIRRARQEIRSRLADRVPSLLLHDLLVVVTELVTNSVRHGPGEPIQLRLSVRPDGTVRGEVEDQGSGTVAISDIRDGINGGLGLLIVDTLTDRWAVYEGSTHVWFEMRPPGDVQSGLD